MKLELKHISPYIPYDLEFKDPETVVPGVMVAICAGMPGLLFYENKDEIEYFDLSRVKPLLIPLSELPKQAKSTVVGIRNIDQINSKSWYLIKHKGGETCFYDLPEEMPIEDVYDTYEQLFAAHYDVFGLIEKGLALNKLDHI